MKRVELLAPAGNISKLQTALHFGADAVYLSDKEYGLRAYADNFTLQEIEKAVELAHSQAKKIYVTVNIFAHNVDFNQLEEYLVFLQSVKVDAVIVSDPGVIAFIKQKASNLKIHLSTQANTLNKYAVMFWAKQGVERIVLARELSLQEIKEIKEYVGDRVELEVFAHGAMCISYSGRCLLSNYLADRDANKGECVQCCRWEYIITEKGRQDKPLVIDEDSKGTYILSSKDLCTATFLDRLIETGIDSIKLEGRMKSEYYVGAVTHAYRWVLDNYYSGLGIPKGIEEELEKISHREYTSGFYLGKKGQGTQNISCSSYDYIAEVLSYNSDKGLVEIRQRNRFKMGDHLEVLSANDSLHNQVFTVTEIYDEQGNPLNEGRQVCQILHLACSYHLQEKDMLRRKKYARE